jgi:hypothetical protein
MAKACARVERLGSWTSSEGEWRAWLASAIFCTELGTTVMPKSTASNTPWLGKEHLVRRIPKMVLTRSVGQNLSRATTEIKPPATKIASKG